MSECSVNTPGKTTRQCSSFLPLRQGSRTSLRLGEDVQGKRSEQRRALPILSWWKHMQFEKMKWGSACSTWSSQSQGAGLGGSGGRELIEGSFCHTQQGNSAWEKQAYHTVCSQCCKQVPEAWWHKRKRKICMVSTHMNNCAPGSISPHAKVKTQNNVMGCIRPELRVFLGNRMSG